MRASPELGTGRGLVWLVWLLIGAHTISLLSPPAGDYLSSPRMLLATLAAVAPVLLCWVAVARAQVHRGQAALAAAAVTVFVVGDLFFALESLATGPWSGLAPAASWISHLGFLSFYPLIFAALGAVIHRQIHTLSLAITLDCVVGGLGAAAVASTVLWPVFAVGITGPATVDSVCGALSPVLDLVVIAAVAGIASSPDLAVGRRWILLALGLLAFAAGDSLFALATLDGSYSVGRWLDAGWAVGLGLIATWVWEAAGGGRASAAPERARAGVRGTWVLGVPVVATIAGLGVLLVASGHTESNLTVGLAATTLVVASARTVIAFVALGRMGNLTRLARSDDLTGLPNRRALYAEVPPRLAPGGRSALLLLDLDRFKEVNDSLGHDIGDELLVQVGRRIGVHVRENDLLVRLGGDEFAIFLDDAGRAEAEAVAVKVQAALAVPYTLEGIALQTSASIGIALSPDHGDDLSGLMRKADMAMYRAKAAHKGHRVYQPIDDSHGDARLRTVHDLRTALGAHQLVLHYQPKIDLARDGVSGVEALVRWNHPTRGLLLPADFLEIVEESGLMPAMTRRVFELALDQAAVWHRRGETLTIAVNLAASSLLDAGLPELVTGLIAARGLPSTVLMVEITEAFLLDDQGRARGILDRLRSAGIQISVDDFGVGYSSLAFLRELPVDELKLDRSFVFPMSGDARAAAVVSSSIHLAHSLGLRMVAEGVEDADTYAQLAGYGCDQVQGYHISRPLPARELDDWLAARLAGGAPGSLLPDGTGTVHP